jgi:mono/diheme cytochrome c family protein
VRFSSVAWLTVLTALTLVGCGKPPDAVFAINDAKVSPLLPEAQKVVVDSLQENFGTPTNLVAWQKFNVDYGTGNPQADDLHPDRKQDGWRLKEGRNLYMQHCLHCHGVAGDGNGPTARFLNPRPRDYRQGLFKFQSNKLGQKPRRDDIVRILEMGIPGTYMPSFVLLGEEKLALISDYVRWLSIRGNYEIRVANEIAATGATINDVKSAVLNDDTKKLTKAEAEQSAMKSLQSDLAEILASAANDLAENWLAAEDPETLVVPKTKRVEPTPESIEKGRLLFLSKYPNPEKPDKSKETKCAECHGAAARGDGPLTESFWKVPDAKPERTYERRGLHDAWGFPQKPRDLTRGVYRGGRRPVDIFRRIHQGIPGTQMPGFASSLSEEEIWHIVNYVLSVPFEGKHSAYPVDLDDPQAAAKHDVAGANE